MFGQVLQKVFFGNSVLDYLVFICILVIGFTLICIFRKLVLIRLKEWAKRTTTTIDDFLVRIFERNLVPLLYFGVFYLDVRQMSLTASLGKLIDVIGIAFLTIVVIRFIISLLDYILKTYFLRKEDNTSRERSLKGMVSILKIVVWGLGTVFLLDNLGFKISAVIAGLGIGGVAVALAAQAVLKDLFSYFAIFFDRPFEIGDFIIVGDYLGTIEHVGIKTTRIRSLGGEQIVFSNTDLTNSRIRNYKRMGKRRVAFQLGVVYQTTTKQVKEISHIIKNVIAKVKNTTFDRAHFSSFGDFSLNFAVVYYVLSKDYNIYMDIQQEINFAIKEEFEKRGIEFAYPTQTLFVSKTPLENSS